MEISREPVSAVMGVKAASRSLDEHEIFRALTAWQWERLDRLDALKSHGRDCTRCQAYSTDPYVLPFCIKGVRLAGEAFSAAVTIARYRTALETVDYRRTMLF
jgi:hypothetical protein